MTCPVVDDSYRPSGGGDGASDGFLETRAGALANAGVATRVDGTWQSPDFTYDGAAGKDPDRLTFSLARRDDTGALLDVAGGTATYSVEIVDAASGNVVANPIDGRPLNPASAWTSIDPAAVNPARLKLGHSYAIRITSRFATSGAEAIPAAAADYDNVVLEAALAPSSGGSGGGGTGGGRTGGGGPVFLSWHRLIVQAKCPKALHAHTCLMHLATYTHGFSGLTRRSPRPCGGTGITSSG